MPQWRSQLAALPLHSLPDLFFALLPYILMNPLHFFFDLFSSQVRLSCYSHYISFPSGMQQQYSTPRHNTMHLSSISPFSSKHVLQAHKTAFSVSIIASSRGKFSCFRLDWLKLAWYICSDSTSCLFASKYRDSLSPVPTEPLHLIPFAASMRKRLAQLVRTLQATIRTSLHISETQRVSGTPQTLWSLNYCCVANHHFFHFQQTLATFLLTFNHVNFFSITKHWVSYTNFHTPKILKRNWMTIFYTWLLSPTHSEHYSPISTTALIAHIKTFKERNPALYVTLCPPVLVLWFQIHALHLSSNQRYDKSHGSLTKSSK